MQDKWYISLSLYIYILYILYIYIYMYIYIYYIYTCIYIRRQVQHGDGGCPPARHSTLRPPAARQHSPQRPSRSRTHQARLVYDHDQTAQLLAGVFAGGAEITAVR